MKLILSGANGFIGNEVLTHALSDPRITTVVALSRKPLSTSSPKLRVVIVEDFLSYPPTVLEQLAGADACIWTIGAKAITDPKKTQRITVDYTMYAANVLEKLARNAGKPIHFLFTSGVVSERDPEKSLWLFAEGRKVSGSVETLLLDFSTQHPQTFKASIVKPGAVLSRDGGVMNCALKVIPNVYVDELAAAMLDVVTPSVGGGKEEKKIYDNAKLKIMGKEVLTRK